MNDYTPTIGLEIHAELKTQTKMFCLSRNDSDEKRPNVNICPVCLAHPGTLPVINREAVKHVLRVGLALHGTLADYTEFDRKNYFYPDLPKGYQLSQYEYPLVSRGELEGVAITRVHLEEDTASSIHDETTGTTTIDYNRAGVPLMELVTEPVITSAEEAGRFARELQLLLRCLGASEANMEKGEMRVEANVSVSKGTRDKGQGMGTKVEIKNLNSFRAMERAVAYEINRQTTLLKEGKSVMQETRGWDEAKQATFAQRTKEGSADYRYFPDPDLPSLRLSEIAGLSIDTLNAELPELPSERRSRYVHRGIREEDARTLASQPALIAFFDQVLAALPKGVSSQLAANYVTNDLIKLVRDRDNRDTEYMAPIAVSPSDFAKILSMVVDRRISSRVAKNLLAEVFRSQGDSDVVTRGLASLMHVDEAAMAALVDRIIADNKEVADDYKRGKTSALEYLVGQGMRETRGAAAPDILRELFRAKMG